MISVIIPVYNVEKYLERCVSSVINQTFRDLEIILVDDGSTDNSGKICDDLKQTDSRIKVLHKHNGGLSSARNEGLKYATGEFVCFVDSDDWIATDMYEYLFNLQQKIQADIVSCVYEYVRNYTMQSSQKHIAEKVFNREDALINFLQMSISSNSNDCSACTKLYRKKLFDNIKFPNGLLYEDTPTNFQLIQLCNKYVLTTKIGYFYFQDSVSITRNQYQPKHNDLLTIASLLKTYSVEESPEIKHLVNCFEYKAYFSLLWKPIKFGKSPEITKEFVFNNLLKPYRRNFKTFFKVKLPLQKKIISVIFYLFYEVLWRLKRLD